MKIKIIRDYLLNNVLCAIPDKLFLQVAYRVKVKRSLDLDNPKLFTEKMQWSKLNYRCDLLTTCCDKFSVRDYVESKIGSEYLIPCIGFYKDFDSIDLSKLPQQFVMKGVHGSGMNHLVFDKESVNWRKIRSDFSRWLSLNQFYHSREWQYKDVSPGIIIEEMLVDNQGHVPNDIKIHCFKKPNGDVEQIIQLDTDRFGSHKQNYFSSNWELLDLSFSNNNFCVEVAKERISPPDNLSEMLTLAKKLSNEFPYVRVDLFTLNGKIYFGELTFHHQSGLTKPSGDWDVKLGELLHFTRKATD